MTPKRFFFTVIFTVIATGLGLLSCDNNKDLVPSFIVINKEDITIRYNSILGTGSTAHDLSDVWVQVNGKNLGCWELPARIPVLERGNCNITVKAGIVLNGMKASHSAYSFFESFKTTADLEPRMETRLYPEFAYADNVTFPFIENFESAGIQLTSSSDSQADITTSGLVELKDTAVYFDLRSENLYLLNDGTCRIFFELNYKTDASVGIGLFAVGSSGSIIHHPILMINPSGGQWKKIYVDLSQVVGKNYAAKNFILQITGFRENDNPANFYFNNLRILQHPSYY